MKNLCRLGLVIFFALLTRQGHSSDIESFFNHDPHSSYVNPYNNTVREGQNLEEKIVQNILSAQQRVFVAIHELRLPRVSQALIAQKQKGIDVRVILENTHNYSLNEVDWNALDINDTYRTPRLLDLFAFVDQNQDNILSRQELAERDSIWMLRKAGVLTLDDTADGSKGSGLMHHKFMVIDEERVLTSSANFTLSGIHGDFLKPKSTGNANVLSAISSFELNQAFEEEFLMMWGDGPGGSLDSLFGTHKKERPVRTISLPSGESIKIQFAPAKSNTKREETALGLIDNEVANVRNSLDFALFVFSDQELSNNLEKVHNRNVSIRGLVESGFIYRYYSSAMDMLGFEIKSQHCRLPQKNYVWKNPLLYTLGFPRLEYGDVLHHKFAVLDNKKVIMGSFNWSSAANSINDETLLVVKSQKQANAFASEFQRLYANSELGMTPKLRAILEKDRNSCSMGSR